MKKYSLLVIALVSLLSACNTNNKSEQSFSESTSASETTPVESEESESESEEEPSEISEAISEEIESEEFVETTTPAENDPNKGYVDERDFEFENKIEKPSSVVHNYTELASIIDYHAFYKDAGTFTVKIAEDYTYLSTQKKVFNEINLIYWDSELINGVMGMMGSDNNDGTWTISLTYYHNAHVDSNPDSSLCKDVFYKEEKSTRSIDYNNFATEVNSKTPVDVYTSQQLWYAAEHNYRPVPMSGSPAETYYNKCKEVLRKIVVDDMTKIQKYSAIYDYIEHNSTYCHEALYTPDAEDEVNFPDEYAATYKAYFIEGFFDNHTVVCDGYSKVYTLLCRMEGLEAYRAIGSPDHAGTSKAVAGHAYCYIEYNNEFYFSCPTWGQSDLESGVVLHKKYFLALKGDASSYSSMMLENLTFATSRANEEYFKNTFVEINGQKMSLFVESEEQVDALFGAFKSNNGRVFADLYFANYELRNRFTGLCSKELLKINTTIVQSYEVICYR